jgi:hypothetical protein
LLDIERNLDRLVAKTCTGAGVRRAGNSGGLFKARPYLGQIRPNR